MDDRLTGQRPQLPVRTWSSFFSGLVWMCVGWVVIVASQMVAAIFLASLEAQRRGARLSEAEAQEIMADGDTISIGLPLAMVSVLAMVAVVINARRKRSIADYLALNPLPVEALVRWLWVAAILLVVNILADALLGRPAVKDWLVHAYITADRDILFFLGIVICAPILEEVLFRGYVLRAWLESRLPPGAVIALLSAAWALSHIQYDLYDMSWIFVLGLLLAYARIRSGSLYPAIAIHCAWNLVSFIILAMNSDAQIPA
jgi:membrane protease YdiL (CAAX protease family)